MSSAAIWIDPEITILSAVSQTWKDKYHMISLICWILFLKNENDTNEFIYKTEKDLQVSKTKLWLTTKGEMVGGINQELGWAYTHY